MSASVSLPISSFIRLKASIVPTALIKSPFLSTVSGSGVIGVPSCRTLDITAFVIPLIRSSPMVLSITFSFSTI